MRVLVTGDRDYTNEDLVWAILDGIAISMSPYDEEFVVIEGQCPYGGADKFAENWAMGNIGHVDHKPYPADWDRYGTKAGPIRNRQMLKEGKPDLVIGFHNDIEKSRGTKDMLNVATKAGVKAILISEWK